jgi:hypothetical protein
MNEPELNRWVLLRDTLVFQVKLTLDAFRDVILSPISMLCVLIDLLNTKTVKKSLFYRLMGFGHRSDRWLNVFGAQGGEENLSEESVDQIFEKLEDIIKDQHNKGGLTASAKTTIDRYLDKISGMNNTSSPETCDDIS